MTTRPTLVLDTNALADRHFRFWLRSYPGRVVLPAVAYTEAGVLFRRHANHDRFDAILRAAGIEVEWYRSNEADIAIRTGIQVGDFAENARDHMIAAHASTVDRRLVTANLRDFTFAPDRMTPQQAMKEYVTG